MRIVIAGGYGAIARALTRLLVAGGHEVRSLVRSSDQLSELAAMGADSRVCDLESVDVKTLTDAVSGGDAVVFAAGAGPGSGADRKETVDYGAAVKLMDAAAMAGIRRYLMISSARASPDHPGDEVFDVYLRAKGRADAALRSSSLDYTIIAPVSLTDDPGTGRITVDGALPGMQIPREDVAAVLAATFDVPGTVGKTIPVASGTTPVTQALTALQ